MKKEISIKLNLDYTDIKSLRKIKGLTIAELAEKIPITESYLSLLENGKKDLSLVLYKQIMNALDITLNLNTNLNIEDLIYNIKKKGGNKMKKSIKEITIKLLEKYLSENKKEWCIDGINAFNELLKLYINSNDKILICNKDYAVYDGTDCGNYNMLGRILTFDKETFEKEYEKFLKDWVIPTKEGYLVDMYLINTEIEFIDNLPIIYGGFYQTKIEQTYTTDGYIIEKDSIGYLEAIDEKGNFELYFGKGNHSLVSKRGTYSIDQILYVPQIVKNDMCFLLK